MLEHRIRVRDTNYMIMQQLVKATPESIGDKFVEQNIKDFSCIVRYGQTWCGTRTGYRCDEISLWGMWWCQPLVEWLHFRGHQNVDLDAFVVCSLGSQNEGNEPVLEGIGSKLAILIMFFGGVNSLMLSWASSVLAIRRAKKWLSCWNRCPIHAEVCSVKSPYITVNCTTLISLLLWTEGFNTSIALLISFMLLFILYPLFSTG